MINSDFDEEYFRVENVIETNEQEFFLDRENVLTFTTPIENETTIRTNQRLELSNNIQPQNTNLIIDQITLFSTNPQFENYLPLKLRLDEKVKIEFPNVNKPNTLTKYKVLSTPPVNLNQITNYKWSARGRNYQVPLSVGSKTPDVVATEDNIYTLDRTGEVTETVKSTGVDQNLISSTNYNRIYANKTQAVGSEGVLDDVIYDLITDTLIVDYGLLILEIYNIDLSGDNMFVTLGNATNTADQRLDIYERSDNGYSRIYSSDTIWNRPKEKTNNYQSSALRLSGGIGDDLVNAPVGQYLEFASFLSNGTTKTVIDTRLAEPIDVVKDIYLSGSNISEPIVNVFSKSGGNVVWNIIDDWTGLQDSTVSPSKTYTESYKKIPIPVSDVDLLIKRFLNTAYFTDSERIYLLNLDNGTYQTVPTSRAPSEVVAINFERTGSQTFSETTVSVAPTVTSGVVNNRPMERNEDDVYSVSFNYDERAFPYTINNRVFSFELELPRNNSIIDLEIFKYVIDLRIRYSKQERELLERVQRAVTAQGDPLVPPTDINEMEQCMDDCGVSSSNPIPVGKPCVGSECERKISGEPACNINDPKCNTCFKRCTRNVGSVGRVLGYVDSDFSVVDFLNIYKSV